VEPGERFGFITSDEGKWVSSVEMIRLNISCIANTGFRLPEGRFGGANDLSLQSLVNEHDLSP
jgi:hypothetical protein